MLITVAVAVNQLLLCSRDAAVICLCFLLLLLFFSSFVVAVDYCS